MLSSSPSSYGLGHCCSFGNLRIKCCIWSSNLIFKVLYFNKGLVVMMLKQEVLGQFFTWWFVTGHFKSCSTSFESVLAAPFKRQVWSPWFPMCGFQMTYNWGLLKILWSSQSQLPLKGHWGFPCSSSKRVRFSPSNFYFVKRTQINFKTKTCGTWAIAHGWNTCLVYSGL